MAFVVPIVAAISTVATAGGVVAAMSTVAGFLTVAGGALAAVGAISGNDKLVKLGGILSLGGGLANMATAAGNAAGAAAEVTAEEAARQAAQEGFRASEIAAQNAGAIGDVGANLGAVGGAAADAGALRLNVSGVTDPGLSGALEGVGQGASSGSAAGGLGSSIGATGPTTGVDVGLGTGAGAGTQGLDLAGTAAKEAVPMFERYSVGLVDGVSNPIQGAAESVLSGASPQMSVLQQQAQGLTAADMRSFFDKAGRWVKDNKELVELGTGALKGMYGPEAEMVDQRRREAEWQQSLYDRRNRNLNSPVRLSYPYGG